MYYWYIKSCDPGWDMTQKSDAALDSMITFGVFAEACTDHHRRIRTLNQFLRQGPVGDHFRTCSHSSETRTSLVSVYNKVKTSLDIRFKVETDRRERLEWQIDDRPVIYVIRSPESGPIPPVVNQVHIDSQF